MKRLLPLFFASAAMTALNSSAETFSFNLDFKDATVTYTEGSTLHTVNVSELGQEAKVYKKPEIQVGPLTFSLASTSSGEAALSFKDDCLFISSQYKEDMGSYTMTQNIYKIFWTVSAEGGESYMETFTLTSADGYNPCPYMSYSSTSKTEGNTSMPSTTSLLWVKNNDNMKLHAVALPNMGYNASKNPVTFCWKNITGSYSAPDPVVCTDFTQVRALADGTEYTYTGQAVVTWYDPQKNNLWMRDAAGTGMYFRECTIDASVRQGDLLKGTFKATYDHGFGTGFNENQINSIFSADGFPSFEGRESVMPKFVDTTVESTFNYDFGEFSVEYECDYVEIQGKYLNSYDNPPFSKCILITVDDREIVVATSQDKNDPHISNARPSAASTSAAPAAGDIFYWYPGDDVPDPAAYPVLKARGLVMRVATGLQLWPLVVASPSTPLAIGEVKADDGDAPCAYYTTSGVRVSGTPAPGLYIRVAADGTATKVAIN